MVLSENAKQGNAVHKKVTMSLIIFCSTSASTCYVETLASVLSTKDVVSAEEVEANVKKVLVTRMGYNFCYYFYYLYSSIVYKLLFILEETKYLCKLLSTMEVGDYELLSSMVEVVKIVEVDVHTK